MSGRRVHGFLQDEQGDWSLARLSFVVALGFTLAVIIVDVRWSDVPEVVYGLLEAVVIALAAWAGAPRAMRYLKRSVPSRPDTDVPEPS